MVPNRNRRTIESKTFQLLDKQGWLQHMRYMKGMAKKEALDSWVQQEKRIQGDGIEYAMVMTHSSTIEYENESGESILRQLNRETEQRRMADLMATAETFRTGANL